MKLIPLTQGQFAMVDDADYEAVSQFKWYAQKGRQNFYAVRKIRRPDGTRTVQSLHQFLMPEVPRIDHRDGNGLNNQRYNLRPATHKQNSRGACHKRPGAKSVFRGVSWHKRNRKWAAWIGVEGQTKYLGSFDCEESAARAYDSAAVFYFGEYASPNFDIGQITIT